MDHKNHQNLNILRPIYFKKYSAHRFEEHICMNKLEELIFFIKKKIILFIFFRCDYLISIY